VRLARWRRSEGGSLDHRDVALSHLAIDLIAESILAVSAHLNRRLGSRMLATREIPGWRFSSGRE